MFASYSGPSADLAVLHETVEAYEEAIASGHKDTFAEEAWADEPDEEAEKAELKAKLKEAGISFGGNTGIAKLRELVASIPKE